MPSDLFKEKYALLNKDQKKAVDSIEGPVMVIAGPGTGKTEILTLRIANILQKTDVAPENILALTFTDAASANMRRRLASLIGPRAYRVNIGTFHSFCNNVIKDYPEYFDAIIGSSNITEVEGISILEKIVEKLPLSILKPWGDPFYYIKDINRKIEELKREGVGPDTFAKLLDKEERNFKKRDDLYHEKGAYKGKMKGEHKDFERLLEKNKELSQVYDAYQKELAEKRLYDWSDMIMEVLNALSSKKDLKLHLQENNQYILVDEHQDTNNSQNRILEILCDFHKNPNIFIVGDEKQAIFRFQGASLNNFYYFKEIYPESKIISLSTNYRSGQNILDAAHSLLAGESALVSGGKEDSSIEVAEFKSKKYELYFVAKEIKDLVKKKVSPKEIAVIYRSNKEAFPIAEVLEKEKISYVIESDEDLLSEKFVRKVIAILEAIFNYGEDSYLIPILHIEEFGIEALKAYRLIALSSKRRVPLYDLLKESKDETIKAFDLQLAGWVKESKSEGLSHFLEKILRESRILDSMISSRDAEAFLGIERLFEEAKKLSENRKNASLTDFVEYLNVIRNRNLFIKRPKHNIRQDAVRLMTAHRSKGLEFEHVFIINATERSFGDRADRDSLKLIPSVYELGKKKDVNEGSINDERRLFYVSLTRAKKRVVITYSSFDESGKEILPSPFILEIRNDKKNIVTTSEFEERLQQNPLPLYQERKKTAVVEIDKEFVAELFSSHPMSVSALNNYLSCPWKYFYRNLLRIPSVPEKHQLYGTAMHGAIEDLWRVIKERDPGKDFLLDSYKRRLGLLGMLNKTEFTEALDRGTKALSGWFLWAKPKITNPIVSEFSVPLVELEEGIQLSGKLDKVEFLKNKSVVVTDYKTGKPKTRNYIEGKTREKNMDIIRQLQFYKLLLKLHDDINMERGVIEFLEPNESGKYSREEFEVSNEDLAYLKETIRKVVHEIKTLDFWDKTCGDKNCEYCSYRSLLNK